METWQVQRLQSVGINGLEFETFKYFVFVNLYYKRVSVQSHLETVKRLVVQAGILVKIKKIFLKDLHSKQFKPTACNQDWVGNYAHVVLECHTQKPQKLNV